MRKIHKCPRCEQRSVDYDIVFDGLVCSNCDWTSDQPEKFEFVPPLTHGDGI